MGERAASPALTDRLKAYQARLRAAGQLIQARTVGQCIKIIQRPDSPAPQLPNRQQ